jgi:uncharacterized protein (TIGR00288 family)
MGASEAPHAALLIDFDNVTMGMRSDLSKELKTLLGSDVIKGKVSVQRAYADWRRYPQYIVPLSEASVDLIFAPAYGSNKKNATDIRMAIDALELVFIRPEIGTYILLTGDSDFSSLVLKLKEYGKYVIGVGIQESTSDILVQNCDEYYSYTTLTGLRKTTESDQRPADPWVLVKDALKRMVDRDDVMRSDRLKQVMQEIDASFDEGELGFSKFSKFLTEASSRGLVALKKLDNGQYEVGPSRGRGRKSDADDRDSRGGARSRGGRRDRDRDRERHEGGDSRSRDDDVSSSDASGKDPLREAYALLTRSLEELREDGRDPVRDSDVKRKMLEFEKNFDEAELGFSKFSKFLAQAEDHDVIRLSKTDAGNYEVALADGSGGGASGRRSGEGRPERRAHESSRAPDAKKERARHEEATAAGGDSGKDKKDKKEEGPKAKEKEEEPGETVMEIDPSKMEDVSHRLGPRKGSTRRRGSDEEGPVLFEGQVVTASSGSSDPEPSTGGDFDASALGLPTDPDAIVRYLTHRYRGVGEKTAESLVQRYGTDLFRVLRDHPESINDAVTPKRAEQVLEAWRTDYERRMSRRGNGAPEGGHRRNRDSGPRGRSES